VSAERLQSLWSLVHAGLTPPSSGQLTAGCAGFQPPLMSNVRCLRKGRWLHAKRRKPNQCYCESPCAAAGGVVASAVGGAAIRGQPFGLERGATVVLLRRRVMGIFCRPQEVSGRRAVSHALRARQMQSKRCAPRSGKAPAWGPVLGVLKHRARVKMYGMQSVAPNPSIERTSLSWLRQPKAAAHVER
jgi:hypothetical protein